MSVEAQAGDVNNRSNLKSNYDEAAYLILHQVDAANREGKKSKRIHSFDTDVYVVVQHVPISKLGHMGP